MTLRLLILLAVFGQPKCSYSTSISGEISEDVTFLHKTFPVPPFRTDLMMGIYTTEDHVNIQNQCTQTRYGQLGNKHLHQTLNSGHPACKLRFDGGLHCRDTITIQDFMLRTFSFSFGFECYLICNGSRAGNPSLNGLVYNVSISGHKYVNCRSHLGKSDTEMCNFQSVAPTNLLGNKLSQSKYIANILQVFYDTAVADGNILERNPLCNQHFSETACHIFLPPCLPDSLLVMHACKEACYDMLRTCKHDQEPYWILDDFWEFDCGYLPSIRDGPLCFYKPVRCYEPAPVEHATKWK